MNSYLYLHYRPLNYSSIPKVEYNLNFLNESGQILSIGQQRLDVYYKDRKHTYCIQNSEICRDANDYDNFITSTLSNFYLTKEESLFTLILNPDKNVTMPLNPVHILQTPTQSLLDTSKYLIKVNASNVAFDKAACSTVIPTNITYSSEAESIKEAIDCTLSYQSNIVPNNTDQIWMWDKDQPEIGDIGCVVALKNGKWKSFACGEPTRFACQSLDDPLKWIVSEKFASFQNIIWDKTINCPDGYKFGVPRLPIIQRRLTSVMVDNKLDLILINLSDVWVPGCYRENADECLYMKVDRQTRLVTVSIVGGLIMLILTFLCVYLNYKRYSKYMKNERRRRDVAEKLRLIQLNNVPK
eukprot:NODE_15_length_42055_cov_0.634117.p11 type:complete len:355 gc:universal NODE_15_length_42055_cov_0.634117:28330-29394(+)